MNRLAQLLLSLALVVTAACHNISDLQIQDFDVEVYSPKYAVGFEIVGAKDMQSTILRVHNPWQGADGGGLCFSSSWSLPPFPPSLPCLKTFWPACGN